MEPPAVEPTRVAQPPAVPAGPTRVAQAPAKPGVPPGRRRTGLILAIVGIVVLVGLALLFVPFGGGEGGVAEGPTAVAEPSPEPSPSEEPSPEPTPSEEPSPSAEPPLVNPLVGTWEGFDADGSLNRLIIRKNGSLRSIDVNALACDPDGLIVVQEVGEFRRRGGRDQLVLRNAFADCRQGSGDLTIPEFILEHDPATDRCGA